MKFFCTILFCLCAGALAVRAELPAGWNTNFSATLAEASANQAPVLIYFTASWCGPCKLMSRITLDDPAIVQTLSGIQHVAVDIDEHQEMAAKLGITAVPTFVLLSANGEEAQRTSGLQAVSEFLPWLTNSIFETKAATIQLALLRTKLAEVDRLLDSTNAETARQVATELFDLCAARDGAVVHAAASRLQTLATHHPMSLLAGLDDPRLAVRIQVANALRARSGESFSVDVWSEPTNRGGMIEEFRKRLAEANDAIHAP